MTKFKFLTQYFVWDYIIDEKDKLTLLEEKLKLAKSRAEVLLLTKQINQTKLNILESYQRYSKECPRSVLEWALGKRKTRPSTHEILEESYKLHKKRIVLKHIILEYVTAVLLIIGGFWFFVRILRWLLT